MLQLRSPPAGSGSFTTTFAAVPGPLLVTTMSKPMLVPALTGPAGFAVLVMVIFGHCTRTLAVEVPPPSLPEATVAVLLTVAQSALVVCEVRWIGPWWASPAMVAKVQFRTCAPADPVTKQPVKAGLSDQFRSPPAGSGSLRGTFVAVPAP